MSYINYECTICRRTKGFVKDNQRIMPDQCMITKGCLGRLIPVDESQALKSTPAVAGIDDWYARGVQHSRTEVDEVVDFGLSTSSTGSLVLAIKSNDESSLPIQLQLALEQKRVGDVEFQQFSFKLSSTTTVISGRDSNGKNLRFDALAIAEDRVVVKVNGVVTNAITLEPNKVTLDSAVNSGMVDVLIFAEKSVVIRNITMTRNKSLIPSITRGSWSNIDYVTKAEVGGGTSTWYLYSTDAISGLTAGKIRIVGNGVTNDAVFLLASSPFQSTDRYLNFVVEQSSLAEDFNVSHESGKLTASVAFLSEIFPPFKLVTGAYISTDLYTVESSSAVITDTEETRFVSRKILGPV